MKTFTIVSSRDQKKYVIETEATTMAELTAAMDAANIDYYGMTLYEGLTKAEYDPSKGDAILPHDVPYKGETTDNLVFMLTAPQKKIKSGMNYNEMKAYIKNNNLSAAFTSKYGKNYTQGKTTEFAEFIANNQTKAEASVVKTASPSESTDENLRKAFRLLIATLLDNEYICDDDADSILYALAGIEPAPKAEEPKKSPYSDGDIDSMFADM